LFPGSCTIPLQVTTKYHATTALLTPLTTKGIKLIMSANAAETVVAAVGQVASSTVETITEAVKNTSIASKSADVRPDISEADAAHAASAAEGRRLYIGNLAYSTTDDQLKDFFRDFSM